MTMSNARPDVTRGHAARALFGLALAAAMLLTPAGVNADTSGGQASAYVAYRTGAATCSVWSPLFMNNADGWSSTIVVRNEGTASVTVDFRMRPLIGGALISRSLSIPQFGVRQITGSDLSLPDGFRGSLAATANPCGRISGVAYHDSAGRNRITLESQEVAAINSTIPLVFNDFNGWSSQAIVQNTNPQTDATVLVTYRGDNAPEVEQSITVRRDSSFQLDLGTAPKGAITVQLEVKTGGQLLAASAYHLGPNGIADGNNASAESQGARKVFIPLVYRNYNDYNSGVRVVNVTEGGSQPRITFFDNTNGERVGTLVSSRTLREGESTTFYLPDVDFLQDNRIYSAVVEPEAGGGDTLVALANHVNYRRNTAMLYSGAARGDTNLTAAVVVRGVSGLNSGIQVQNLTGSQGSVTVRFKNAAGTIVAAETQSVQGNNSVTFYLPAIANLPDGFVGFAEINSSTQVAATVNMVRYTAASTSPTSGT